MLHDLHESVPFLYDNTVGDGPYNAWVDPIARRRVGRAGLEQRRADARASACPESSPTAISTPGRPGYLMFLAGMHNGISAASTKPSATAARTPSSASLQPEEYSRTWYRQNPPSPQVTWSQRDNNNYEESALLTTLSYFSTTPATSLKTSTARANVPCRSRRSTAPPPTSSPPTRPRPTARSNSSRYSNSSTSKSANSPPPPPPPSSRQAR